MAQVFIGLGSNLSDPVRQLKRAIEHLKLLESTSVVTCSSFYCSKPQGPQDQPDFVNAVCLLETLLSPERLLLALQDIERTQGRIKQRHWGERLIDLDILLFDDRVISLPHLTIPHSEIPYRDFVLIPLSEIAPDTVVPNMGTVASLIAQLDNSYLYSIQS